MQARRPLKVYLLSNDDLTSSLVFAPLFSRPNVEVVGVTYTATLTAGKGGWAGVRKVLEKTGWRYWTYLVFTNGCFKVFEKLALLLGPLAPAARENSVRWEANRRGIPVSSCADFNAPEFLQHLRESGAELVLIRINQLLKESFLAVPAQGTWNVHSSLLPSYAGIAGEFQMLRHGESTYGTTVFRVTPRLDEGEPVLRVVLPVVPGASVFTHMLTNNRATGRALADAVEAVACGNQPALVADPERRKPSYFTWPLATDVQAFRRAGGRLISWTEAVSYVARCLTPFLRRGPEPRASSALASSSAM